jgi:hypothetical protein
MTAAALVCGSCGAELPANSKSCNECGMAVSAATKPAEYKHVTVLFADVVRRERPENGWAAGTSGLDAAVGRRSGRDGVPRADRVRRLRTGAGRRTADWCGAAASVRPAADAGAGDRAPVDHRRCGCGATTSAYAPDGVTAPVSYGPRITAIILYLYVGQLLSKQRTARRWPSCSAPRSRRAHRRGDVRTRRRRAR